MRKRCTGGTVLLCISANTVCKVGKSRKFIPTYLVCVEQSSSGTYHFSVLETQGEHLKGNDDTEYKQRLFELLTEYVKTVIDAGELTLEAIPNGMTFKMLMESSWTQEIVAEVG
jgi:type III restriction enzyme